MNLPDYTDNDTHDGKETIACEHEAKQTWNDDDHWPPMLEEADILNPAHDRRKPENASNEEECSPEKFTERIHRDKYKLELGVRN